LKEDGGAYWTKLVSSKTDIKANLALGPHNLMVKDYKQYHFGKDKPFSIGVSSVPVPLETMLDTFTDEVVEQKMIDLCQ